MEPHRLARYAYVLLAALALGALIAAAYEYGDAGLTSRQAAYYFGLPTAALVLFVAAAVLARRLPPELALVTTTTALCLLAVEVGLGLVGNGRGATEWDGIAIPQTNSRQAVIRLLRGHGVEAYPPVFPNGFVRGVASLEATPATRPVAGIADVPTAFCNERTPGFIVYQSDRYGFNNPDRAWDEELDFAILGDSYAHGACIRPEHTIARRLAAHGWSGVTLGYGGQGPLLELAALREYLGHGPARQPPVVLWLYYEGNDMHDLHEEKADSILLSYLNPAFDQSLASAQPLVDRALRRYVEGEMALEVEPSPPALLEVVLLRELRGRLAHAIRRLSGPEPTAPGRWPPDRPDPDWHGFAEDTTLFEAALRTARDEIEAWGGRLVFVYLPEWKRYARPDDASQHRDAILRTANRLRLTVVDMDPAFTATGRPTELFSFPSPWSHYNEEGYRLAAATTIRAIEELGLLRPRHRLPGEVTGRP